MDRPMLPLAALHHAFHPLPIQFRVVHGTDCAHGSVTASLEAFDGNGGNAT